MRWGWEEYSLGRGAIRPFLFFLIAFSIYSSVPFHMLVGIAHIDQFVLCPPWILTLLVEHTDDMSHGGTRQCSIGISAFEDRNDFSNRVLIGKRDYIFRIPGEERCLGRQFSYRIILIVWKWTYRYTPIVPLHTLVLMFTSIKSSTRHQTSPYLQGRLA